MAIGASVIGLLVARGVTETQIIGLKELIGQRIDDVEKMALRRFQNLEEDAGHGAEDLKDAAKELHQVVTELTALAREQAVVNTMMTKTLESLTSKIETHEKLITQHGAEIRELHRRANSIARQSYEQAGKREID